jgi:Thiamine pyrophosphate enzyme, N-terminal TPP binding domain
LAVTNTAVARKLAPGHIAAEVLEKNGVEVVFGLNGDHVLRLYDGLADIGGITHVTVKHENNAALAAEAYGRLTGRPGSQSPLPAQVPSTRSLASRVRWLRGRRSCR